MKWTLRYDSQYAFDHDVPIQTWSHEDRNDVVLDRSRLDVITREQIAAARFTARRLILSCVAGAAEIRVDLAGVNSDVRDPFAISVSITEVR